MLEPKHVGTTLQNLERGERLWFWFCQDVGDTELPLVLVPVATDPTMARMMDIVSGLEVSPSRPQCLGLAHCDEEGRVHFGSPGAEADMLPALAKWVRSEVEEIPGLGRLVDARFVAYDDQRVITGVWEDASLWEGIPAPAPARGGLQDAADTLQALNPGDRVFFWATLNGPGDGPFLVLEPSELAFANRVRAVIRRTRRRGRGQRGVLRITADGDVELLPSGSVERCEQIVGALGGLPGFARLADAIVTPGGE